MFYFNFRIAINILNCLSHNKKNNISPPDPVAIDPPVAIDFTYEQKEKNPYGCIEEGAKRKYQGVVTYVFYYQFLILKWRRCDLSNIFKISRSRLVVEGRTLKN